MFIQPGRIGSILLVSGLLVTSASAQDCSIRGFVKDTDGKGAVGAQIKIQRVDAKGRPITTNTDAKGNYAVTGLPVGTFTVSAHGKEVIKEVDGINTKIANSMTVDIDFGKVSGKQERRYVWFKSQTGSMIPGRWEEVDKGRKRPGMDPLLDVDRATARKVFEESHGYNDPSR
jgi:Carboxypeptidase regulatory-like domain